MDAETRDPDVRLDELVCEVGDTVGYGRSGANKFESVAAYLAELLGVDGERIHVTTADERKNVIERLGAGALWEHHDLGVLLCPTTPSMGDSSHSSRSCWSWIGTRSTSPRAPATTSRCVPFKLGPVRSTMSSACTCSRTASRRWTPRCVRLDGS